MDIFLRSSNLKKMNYECSFCGLAGLQEWQLKSHVKTVHATFKIGDYEYPLEYHFSWTCSMCDFNCYTSPEFNKHVKENHFLASTYKCEHCELTFPKFQTMKRHITSKHEKKNFICKFENCGRGYARNGDLKRHVQSIHEGKKQFGCKQCDFSCSFKWNFIRHLCLKHKKSSTAAKAIASLLESHNIAKPTGQIISEGHFGVLKFPINQRKYLNDFCPSH